MLMLDVCNFDICANPEHGNCAASRPSHENYSPAEVIDEEQDPDDGADRFDDAKHAGGQKGRAGPRDTNGSEYCRRVI